MQRLAGAMGLLALSAPLSTAAAAPPASWTALADCAAAYQANAGLANPGRPASMTAQVSEVASDYARAAERAYRRQAHRWRPASRGPVSARIARGVAAFSSRPREEIDRFIDACPQAGE